MDLTQFLDRASGALRALAHPGFARTLEQTAASLVRARHIWSTGLGKSACAASLLAEDLATLTLPASFVHGGDLLHGGMGRILRDDAVVLFSDRGHTAELVQVSRSLPDTTRILITGSASPLIEASHVLRYAPPGGDAYPLPAATLLQVTIGRMLALSAAELAKIEPAHVAWAHPA